VIMLGANLLVQKILRRVGSWYEEKEFKIN
jgi:hypothetical protein